MFDNIRKSISKTSNPLHVTIFNKIFCIPKEASEANITHENLSTKSFIGSKISPTVIVTPGGPTSVHCTKDITAFRAFAVAKTFIA